MSTKIEDKPIAHVGADSSPRCAVSHGSGVRRSRRDAKPGEPCDHPGCLSHASHPCEGCGRTAGQGYFFAQHNLGIPWV
jgi:hypothetical protein